MVIKTTPRVLFVSLAFTATAFACPIPAKPFEMAGKSIEPIDGTWLLVQAWTLDCDICEKQKPALSTLDSDYNDFKVVAVSLDGNGNEKAVKERIQAKNYSMSHYIAELSDFRQQLETCFGKKYVGTPTYILYSPKKEVMAVRAGPINLASIPSKLGLTTSK